MVTKLPRFKVWISLLKFKVAAKFGVSEESLVNQIPVEDCDAMLRIWDGPLREPPICKDLNWYAILEFLENLKCINFIYEFSHLCGILQVGNSFRRLI